MFVGLASGPDFHLQGAAGYLLGHQQSDLQNTCIYLKTPA